MSKKNGKNTLKATPASAWKPKTLFIELPTGKVVEVRDVDMQTLVMSSQTGDVPDILTPEVAQLLEVAASKGQTEFDFKDAPTLIPFVKNVVIAVMVSPAIVNSEPDYDNGEILFSDMDFQQEVVPIFERLMNTMELATAQRFRPGQDADMDDIQTGEDVRTVAE